MDGTTDHTGPKIFRVSVPRTDRSISCQVEDCEGREMMRNNLGIHFVHRHMRDTVVIMEEGKSPHLRFLAYDWFVP